MAMARSFRQEPSWCVRTAWGWIFPLTKAVPPVCSLGRTWGTCSSAATPSEVSTLPVGRHKGLLSMVSSLVVGPQKVMLASFPFDGLVHKSLDHEHVHA
jgi:hypothetical protein